MRYFRYYVFVYVVFPCVLVAQNNVKAFLPELFADYPNVRDFAISPTNGDLYFTVDDLKSKLAMIVYISKEGENWSEPKAVSFTGHYRDIEPTFSHDGSRLYFASNRPINGSSQEPKDYDIWYVDKTSTGWSEPKHLKGPINTAANEYYPSLTKNNDMYFTADREGTVGSEDIFVSRFVNGTYQDPISAPGELNTKYFEFNAFVNPDETYMIFTSFRPNEGAGGGDLYISYNTNGKWGKAELIEAANSPYLDFCPFVDRTSKTLYFTSQKTEVQPYYEKALTLDGFLNIFKTKNTKGLNRLYTIPIDLPQK